VLTMITLQSLVNPCNLVVLQKISFETYTSVHFVLTINQTPTTTKRHTMT
jgi:hypothetical protein